MSEQSEWVPIELVRGDERAKMLERPLVGDISTQQRTLLMGIRRGLYAIIAAIEDYLGIREGK